MKWIMLLYVIPTDKGSLRVKTHRSMGEVGAQLYQNSTYLLPDHPENRKKMEDARNLIEEGGGTATTFLVEPLQESVEEAIKKGFVKASKKEYEAIRKSLRQILSAASKRGVLTSNLPQVFAHTRRRFMAAKSRDHFELEEGADLEKKFEEVSKEFEKIGQILPKIFFP